MNFQRQVAHAGGHMDVTRDTNGNEVLVWTNSNDAQPIACNNGEVSSNMRPFDRAILMLIASISRGQWVRLMRAPS